MKLTIEHLAPYLLHNTECSYKEYKGEKKRLKAILTGVSTKDGIETTYKRKRNGCSGDYIQFTGNNNIIDLDFKLHLRPLSDLTKEIEHNGEKFVPLIELAKIATESIKNIDYKKLKRTTTTEANYDCIIGNDVYATDFMSSINNQFTFYMYTDRMINFEISEHGGFRTGVNYYMLDYMLLYQKLLEWHFDVFNSIDKGLAKNKNEL